jgi:glycerophosphoryl diester phosphodiesterase
MKITLLLSTVVMSLSVAAFAQNSDVKQSASPGPTARWNVCDHVPLEKFIIQSHRGAGELAEENTIGAFQLGWKLGTYPESDLRTTKDGVIVAFHDENFERVVKGISPEMKKKGVADVTFEELSHMDVGAWKGDGFVGRHVSKMTEVFAQMKGHPERHLYLDIKNVDFKELAREVKEYNVEKQVILASPHYEVIQTWKSLVPESDTLLWISGTDDATMQKKIDVARKNNFAGVTQLQVHVHMLKKPKNGQSFTPSRDFLMQLSDELASHGIVYQTLPYGGSTAPIYWQLLDLGLGSFATDHPDVTLDAVKKYYEKKKNHAPDLK